jgi:hypothetical protein
MTVFIVVFAVVEDMVSIVVDGLGRDVTPAYAFRVMRNV